jgi:hypothetical protein
MSAIASVSPTTAQPSQTASTSQTASADSAVAALGLPPAGLAQAASVNTVNAELVSSQFGIDQSLVSGVYGGSSQSGSGFFSSAELLPALANLSRATAEQSLALMGIQTPRAGSGSGNSAATSAAPAVADASALPYSSTVGAAVVDPLWGKTA